jgi:hypothetical protein
MITKILLCVFGTIKFPLSNKIVDFQVASVAKILFYDCSKVEQAGPVPPGIF